MSENITTSPEPQGELTPSRGWFKANRSEDAIELIRENHSAFVLLYVIAFRAKWHDGFNRHGLGVGEALVGDWKSCGMSEQQYRTAKKLLEKFKFATFQPTPKGTIAKLIDSSLFDISGDQRNDQTNRQLTDAQRTPNDPLTDAQRLTKTDKKEKTVKEGEDGGTNRPPKASAAARKSASEVIAELAASPAYQGIDVAREYAKMDVWCKKHRKQPTESRFIAWLNRIEAPMEGSPNRQPVHSEDVQW